MGLRERLGFERRLARRSGESAVVVLDLMNVTIGPFLDDLMPQVLARVAEVTRSADDVARIGDDQVAICVSAEEHDLPGLCARLEEMLVTSTFRVGERTFALHGVATFATATEAPDGDLLREAQARNAGETMLRIRRIFQEGLLTGGHGGGEQTTQRGFARFATSGAVDNFGAVAAELCFEGERVVAGEIPDRPADNEWTIVVNGRPYGVHRTWQPTALTLSAVFVAAVGAYMNEAFERLVALEQSRHDPLTGLLNRRGVEVAVDEGPPRSVAMVDVDRFKAFNSRMGTAAGDEALVRLAEVLRGCDQAIVGRWGGEEFVLASPLDAVALQAQLLEALERSRRDLRVGDLTVTFSAGVAEVGGEGWGPALLEAERWMRRAKRRRAQVLLAAEEPEPGSGPVVALIESDGQLRTLLRLALERGLPDGGRVVDLAHPADLMSAIQSGPRPDLVVMELARPRTYAWQLLRQMDELDPPIPIIVATSDASIGPADLRDVGVQRIVRRDGQGSDAELVEAVRAIVGTESST